MMVPSLLIPLPLLIGASVSLLLFLLVLLFLLGGKPQAGKAGFWLGAAAFALAIVLTISTHKFLDMAEIAVALCVGGGAGFLFGRFWPLMGVSRLAAVCLSLSALAGILLGLALWLSPITFGLVQSERGGVSLPHQVVLFGAVMLSIVVFLFALRSYWAKSVEKWTEQRLAILAGLLGWAVFLVGLLLANVLMTGGGMLSGASAFTLLLKMKCNQKMN
ncbi:MAG: hypothetical protein E2598_07715 [Sphingobium sp.]|nr:hypothetical protein [Sphingobium sp.]